MDREDVSVMNLLTGHWTRPAGVRVDGASPRGLWPPDGGRLCRRVMKGKVLKMDGPSAQGFLSLTRLRREGCGGGFAAIFKVSVTELAL